MPASRVQFEQIVALASDAILMLDHQGIITYANAAAVSLFGRALDALLGADFGFIVIPDEPTEIEIPRAGGVVSVDLRSVEMAMDGKAVTVLYLRDVSERKLAESALQMANRQLEDAQRIACLGYWEWHPQRRLLAWSPMVYEISGRDPNTYTPTYEGYYRLVHPEDRAPMRAAERGLAHRRFRRGASHHPARRRGALGSSGCADSTRRCGKPRLGAGNGPGYLRAQICRDATA